MSHSQSSSLSVFGLFGLVCLTGVLGCSASRDSAGNTAGVHQSAEVCDTSHATRVDITRDCILQDESISMCTRELYEYPSAGLSRACLVDPSGRVFVTMLGGSREVTTAGWTHSAYGGSTGQAIPSTLPASQLSACELALRRVASGGACSGDSPRICTGSDSCNKDETCEFSPGCDRQTGVCVRASASSLPVAPLYCGCDGATFHGTSQVRPSFPYASDGACKDEPLSGADPCTYVEIPGTATVLPREAPAAGEGSCPQTPARVMFDFAPTDASAKASYKHPDVSDSARRWTIAAGMNPPSGCLDSIGLTVGAKIKAKRREITSGACTPVLFELDVDSSLCDSQCWSE